MEQNKFEITLDLLNEIGAYLGKKPYVEVADLLAKMAMLKPIVEAPAEVKSAE